MKNDIFADIANQRIAFRSENLIEPAPPALEERILPVLEGGNGRLFTPKEKLHTAEQLQSALEEMRERYAPFLADHAPALPSTRERIELEAFDWRVETDPDKANFAGVLSGGGEWQRIGIPHYGPPLGLAAAYYRTVFRVAAGQLAGKAAFVCFKGVDYKAHVFMNGSYLGSHEGFFAPFEFDFTQVAAAGENVLTVKVENDFVCKGNAAPVSGGLPVTGDKIYAATGLGYDDPESGWHHCPPGMGIYQGVAVECRPRLFINDLFIRPMPAENGAQAWLEIFNCDILPRRIAISLSLFGQNFSREVFTGLRFSPESAFAAGLGDTLAGAHEKDADARIPADMEKGVNYIRIFFPVPDFRAWEPEEPWLYQLQARLLEDVRGSECCVDCAKRQFGMRSFSMDAESAPRGMFRLNGRRTRLRGANTMGHEQQCVFRNDLAQLCDDILLAKLCNMNFLRITQRPVQPEVYDCCDKLGMMLQTDLPLFGVLRRNQFVEAVKQAGEMEKLVRPHPSCILVSFINEPFPNAGNKPHRHLTRDELESFFEAAGILVRLHNPDRVVKAVDGEYDPPGPGLPDNHCYCCWYNGHGIDVGKLHKGYWQHVKPGWYYGCGEFGAEGLDSACFMRRRCPEDWLPQSPEEEKAWSPARIPKAQTGAFHYFFYDTPRGLEEWAAAGREHQAWATRFMARAFRRDSNMVSFAIHLFIDAFPTGWMKAIMDADRQPKPAYFAYRDALTPLMVQWRADRHGFFEGQEIQLEAWICNDLDSAPQDALLTYYVEMDGNILCSGRTAADIPACGSKFQGFLRIRAPGVQKRTGIKAHIGLLDGGGNVIHDDMLELEAFPRPPNGPRGKALVIGNPDGRAWKLACEAGLEPCLKGSPSDFAVIAVDDYSLYQEREPEILGRAEAGAAVVFLELPEGAYRIADTTVNVKPCGMAPLHFASRDTGHPLVEGFEATDFRLWHDPETDRIAPLLDATFTAEGYRPVIKTANTDANGEWSPALAVGERAAGGGKIVVCQIKLAGRTETNPSALLFARRLLNGIEV